jgi:hypothetical protein
MNFIPLKQSIKDSEAPQWPSNYALRHDNATFGASPKAAVQWTALLLWRAPARISERRPAVLIEVFVVFLSPPRNVVWQ